MRIRKCWHEQSLRGARSFALFVCAAFFISFAGAQPAPAPVKRGATETISLSGIRQTAEILIDHWGVPHIYAQNEADLFFAQGFNAARDRLFQIDLWRRRGLGQLSEVFGPAYLEQDRAARLFLYRGDMQQEWSSYSDDAQQIATNFVAGINAYIGWLEQHPDRLPFEFKTLHYKPAVWAPEDVVRIRSHGLTGNLQDEVNRANMACVADLKSDEVRVHLEPPWKTQIPEGLDPCLPKDVLRTFFLGTQEVRFTPESISAKSAETTGSLVAEVIPPSRESLEASNNWVVSAAKSATGRAIMANDPHRAYLQPSIRYIADLNSPTLHVTGIGEAAVPGVSNGHNDWIAFGGTYFYIDQQDLYVYKLNPANVNEYKYQGKWEAFRVLREEIKVKGKTPVPVELKFTRHGPVIYMEEAKNRAFAARLQWLEPGTAPYMGSLSFLRAKNFDEFKRDLEHWGSPPINHVYADVNGNIGWTPMGFAAIRPNWDGLLPVPGDGSYEWSGHWSGGKLPRIYNPASGFIATANQMNLPPDYPYQERKLGFEWSPPYRFQRIGEVLSQPKQVSLEDCMRLQNDVVSIPARRFVALLSALQDDDATTQAALKLLKSWNASLNADSPQAALEEVWWSRHLGPAFKAAVLPEAAAKLFERPDMRVLLEALEHPESWFRGDADAQRDLVLLTSVKSAYQEMEKLQGSDSAQWKWEKLHFNYLEHPFSPIVDEATRAKINVGPISKHGSGFTVNASSYRTADFRQIGGPSARLVIDVGNWDNSRAVNHPGQSGDPESPHYRDLAPLWRSGQYFPLLYTRKAVEAATEKKIKLMPRSSPN